MNRQTIEKAALELCTTEGQEEWLKDYGKNCFMDGACWRIDSVWHDMNEKPNGIFVILADFGQEEYSLGINLDGIESAKRWAYVSDLLPERKEDEK